MHQLYVEDILPPIPQTYTFPRVPQILANDATSEFLRWDHMTLFREIRDESPIAFNVINIQAMRLLHELMVAEVLDMNEAQRVANLITAWIQDKDQNVLEVTFQNARLFLTHLAQLNAAARGNKLILPGECAIQDLPRRHAHLRDVDVKRPQYIAGKV